MTNPQAPGADELRVRQLLIKHGVGPDAGPAPVPPKPATRPRDWLDDILDTPAATEPEPAEAPEPEAEQPEPETEQPEKTRPQRVRKAAATRRRQQRRRRTPAEPRTAWDTRPPDPRQSLLDAWDRTPYRLKWLAFHAAAAVGGWRIGLVTWSTNTAAWFAAGHWTSSSAWVLYALGGLAIALSRRARGWMWPVRLLATVPIASVVVGVLLYGTPHQ